MPTGERGWGALVSWAAASDDRVERYFIELKSAVDLTTKSGRHKVAKFVLGAANRDPAKAARRFSGYAILLLGVGPGKIEGIGPFEAKDLEREVQKFTGADGPMWDFERIPIDADHDVIAVVVDPPTDRVWPCLADGEGLVNGDIYLRGDGNTEKAKGAEVQVMLNRLGTAASTLPNVAVEIVGEALALRFDRSRVETWVEEVSRSYLANVGRSTSPYGFLNDPSVMERRDEETFRREVDRWRKAALGDPSAGLLSTAARLAVGINVRVTNPERTPLRDVRIDIEFDSGVIAVSWEDPDEEGQHDLLFPDRPIPWGKDSITRHLSSGLYNRFATPQDDDGTLSILQQTPARLRLSLNLLRPEDEFDSDEEEVVLIAFVDTEPEASLTGKWRLTAGDVSDVLDGSLTVPVRYQDWTDAIAQALGDEPATEA